jgi:hypothetical protein
MNGNGLWRVGASLDDVWDWETWDAELAELEAIAPVLEELYR